MYFVNRVESFGESTQDGITICKMNYTRMKSRLASVDIKVGGLCGYLESKFKECTYYRVDTENLSKGLMVTGDERYCRLV